MTAPLKLSAPVKPSSPPRPLDDAELAALLRVADVLIPQAGENPAASQVPGYSDHLDTALAARADAFDVIVAVLGRVAGLGDEELLSRLRVLSVEDRVLFHDLSSVVAGAYLLAPSVREAIGYPGQRREPPRVDEAANEIEGLIDPVIERGFIYTPAPD